MSLQVVENIVKVNAVEFLPPVIQLNPVKACEAASIFGAASLCRGEACGRRRRQWQEVSLHIVPIQDGLMLWLYVPRCQSLMWPALRALSPGIALPGIALY